MEWVAAAAGRPEAGARSADGPAPGAGECKNTFLPLLGLLFELLFVLLISCYPMSLWFD